MSYRNIKILRKYFSKTCRSFFPQLAKRMRMCLFRGFAFVKRSAHSIQKWVQICAQILVQTRKYLSCLFHISFFSPLPLSLSGLYPDGDKRKLLRRLRDQPKITRLRGWVLIKITTPPDRVRVDLCLSHHIKISNVFNQANYVLH